MEDKERRVSLFGGFPRLQNAHSRVYSMFFPVNIERLYHKLFKVPEVLVLPR